MSQPVTCHSFQHLPVQRPLSSRSLLLPIMSESQLQVTFNTSTTLTFNSISYVIFHFVSYFAGPSLLLLSIIANTPFLLIAALAGTIILSNISAHLITSSHSDHIITTQFLYWLVVWAFLVNHIGVFMLMSQLPKVIFWLCLKLPQYSCL